jgi:hypothetical protein
MPEPKHDDGTAASRAAGPVADAASTDSEIDAVRRYSATPPGPAARSRPGRPALAAGQLRAMVLSHLRAFPSLDFSPAELANVLGRPKSRGAIANACQRLVEQRLATRTQREPQRYRAVT